jgi:hypothetical protein
VNTWWRLFFVSTKQKAMKIKSNLTISEKGFLFNPSNGDSFSLNTTGQFIIAQLKQEKSESEIKAVMLSSFFIDNDTVEKDYYDFMLVLKNYQLLEV